MSRGMAVAVIEMHGFGENPESRGGNVKSEIRDLLRPALHTHLKELQQREDFRPEVWIENFLSICTTLYSSGASRQFLRICSSDETLLEAIQEALKALDYPIEVSLSSASQVVGVEA